MGLRETFIRVFGSEMRATEKRENTTFRPRAGFEDLHDFLIDEKSDQKPKPHPKPPY